MFPSRFHPGGSTAASCSTRCRKPLETSGLAPHRLTLEVAEGVLLADHKTVASTLHALKDLGVRINIDKFGTSIASLREVLDQPFDGIRFRSQHPHATGPGG